MTTKKEIQRTLRTLDRTSIFALAKKCNINVTNRADVYSFIKEYAPSDKVSRAAHALAYAKNQDRSFYQRRVGGETQIIRAIEWARYEKQRGCDNYSKKLIEGNKHIYWASPIYEHSDYNKSIAFENSEKTRKIANTINKYLGY